MHHPALALLSREVHTSLRGRAFPVAVLMPSLLVMLVGLPTLANIRSAAAGLSFLNLAASFQAIVVVLAPALLGSAAVAQEKESKCVDLLLITGMSPASLLAGLTGGRILAVLAMLAAQLPFLALALTAGGVRTGQVLAVLAVLAGQVCLSGALALWITIETPSRGRALAEVLLILAAGPTILTLLGAPWTSAGSKIDEILDATVRTPFPWAWCGWAVAAAAAFYALACLRFEATLRESGPSPRKATAQTRPAPSRPRPQPHNAFLWKDLYFMYGGRMGVVARLLVCLLPLGVAVGDALVRHDAVRTAFTSGIEWAAAFAIPAFWLEYFYHSARMYRFERVQGTADDLLTIPLEGVQVVNQRTRGLVMTLAPYITVWVAMVMAGIMGDRSINPAPLTLLFLLPALILLHWVIADFSLALGWGSVPLALIVAFIFCIAAIMVPATAIVIINQAIPVPSFQAVLYLAVAAGCIIGLWRVARGLRASLARNLGRPADAYTSPATD